MKSKRQQKGVTLLELIVVMIIVGILAAVAIPSYRQYVIRSQRSDAKEALLALATQQEKFYLQCNTYATIIGAAPNCAALTLQGTNASKNGWYILGIDPLVPPANPTTSYTVSAAAAVGGNQSQDTECQIFRIDERGVRTAADGGAADSTAECWR